MRFRPANIRLINRRSYLLRLLLALSLKNNPTIVQRLTGSLHIRPCGKPFVEQSLGVAVSPRRYGLA
jgi:hypothetical protein